MATPPVQPPPVANLISSIEEVQRLVDIHARLTGAGKGRRHAVEVLNKSDIVLLVACWEAFIEDLAEHSYSVLLSGAKRHSAIPKKVLTLASKTLREHPDESAVWQLADSGWKAVLQQHKAATLERHIGKLNTPKPENVDTLFENLLGIKELSNSWHWNKCSNAIAKKRLETLVSLRGSIAHRVAAQRPVLKKDVVKSTHFICYLAAKSANTMRAHLQTTTGTEPWPEVRYGSIF
jgi:hypothetical protein